MDERRLQALVIESCGWFRLLCYHTHDSRRSVAGFPDLVIVGQRVLYRELKSDRGRVTAAQQMWLDRLTAAGADAGVWRPVDWPGRITAELRAAARGSVPQSAPAPGPIALAAPNR